MKKVLLGDITTFLARGTAPKYTDDESFYVLNQKCIRDWRVSLGDVRFTDNTSKKVHSDRILQDGDILVNSTGKGTLGRVAQFSKFDKKATVDSHITIVRPNQDIVDAGYLGYVLKSRQNQIEMMAEGSTGQTELSKAKLSNMTIDLPDINKQKKIADILGSLDEKIELNRHMNETLEQIGQALFRHYLIDNPDAKSWEEKSLDEIADYLNGLAMQKYPRVEGEPMLPVIKIREMSSGVTDNTDIASADIPEKYIVHSGDLLFSWSGTLIVKFWDGIDGALNQHLFKVTSNNYPEWLYYYWTKHHLGEFIRIAKSKATTMGHIQRKHLKESKVLIPPNIDELTGIFEPIINQIKNSNEQIRILITLRDTLLPQLINGKVKL